ncbi:MAG: phosphatidylserine/phosphatidylglycerophosphate/cardiolipin synthase family protein [Acidobacteria bacterium]|uniref:Phosphatidylserine/phosphatidylglycerophosphate/ cardiolipin synthase family protein n=1 Tax=Candidatus Polarisedimenticola svalbardensis TaxID=2886004 RepID=A0A8J7CL14_9BACT|nr:phosphatidylserine/phosphatidylglycerophosphate/cardiolipin synthase family protein [Candidatus Polarisedimenticola svalbardensis]
MTKQLFRLAPLLWLLLFGTVVLAEQVLILDSHSDAAQARVDLVLAATTTIDAAYFIYEDDYSGLAGLYLLREAARRGVQVRLLVDSQWNKVSGSIIFHLAEEGVEVRLYHRFSLCKPFWWTRRMHDKLVVVDREHLIAGGRNIEDPYFGLDPELNYVDRDIYVQGAVAGEASDYFEALWNSGHVEDPPSLVLTREWLEQAALSVDKGGGYLDRSPIVSMETNGRLLASTIQVGSARFLRDEVTPIRKRPGIRKDLVELLAGAESSVFIETPYLVVTRRMRKLFRELLDRGVRVRLLTNSLQSTDNVWPQAGYVGKKKELVRMGIELWEYTGPESMHAKSAVIDGETIVIGSYNLDPRSERLNTEIAIAIEDPFLAADLVSSMDDHLTSAWRIDGNGRPEGYQERYPGVGFWKRVKVRLVRLILPFVRGQL